MNKQSQCELKVFALCFRFTMMSQKLTGSKSVHADDRKDQSDVHIGDPKAEMLYEKADGY